MSERIASVLDRYPEYEAVIGIEVHVQLTTKSKIFCACSNNIPKEPNSTICNICCGYPGSLPVINKQVVDYAILAGLATNCMITQSCTFDRKHYFYPDLPKGYQVTQGYEPICKNGYVTIRLPDGNTKDIRLMRIHMEEDAGKNMHATGGESFVDLNRAGTPLLEVVTYPDIASPWEAKEYLKTLRSVVQYLGICTGNMEEGAFRADTNISVRKKGDPKLGTRCELKNINSFKFIGDAAEYEIERHITILEDGGTIQQETRLWDTKAHKTITMRSKEEAADYRYFEDPDLPIIEINNEWIERVRKSIPELPQQKFERFCSSIGLSAYEAGILVDDLSLANYFEKAYALYPNKSIINWVLRNVLGHLKEHKLELISFKVTPEKLADLVQMLEENRINNHAAQQVFEEVAQTGGDPEEIVKAKGLEQINSTQELEKLVAEIVSEHSAQVEAYKAGNERLFGFFVGQAMKKSGGKANPKVIQELLKRVIGS